MQRKQLPTLVNPISLLGAAMAAFSLVIILVLLVLGATGTIANPYTGILAFMLGPAVLAFGLILIPVGAIRQRRRLAKLGLVAQTFPVLDLNDQQHRRAVAVFSATTAGILSLMAVTTWGAAEFMESREFCGDVCHRVMEPEATAYAASPHARVTCVSCHIGPGAPWLVKSKVSGLRQVVNYAFDRYSRPIPVPIEDLRPSRDTCEQCHWPDRFYGDRYRPFVHYAQDEQNTPRAQPLVFRVGGSDLGHGIHWHTTAKVWYLPLNASRTEIGWVKVEKPDGSVDEYVLADRRDEVTPERIQSEQRFMDCIDCHNRAAHHFAPVEDEVDRAMHEGSISPDIPFIKQQAMKAIGEVGPQVSQEQHQATLKRIDEIESYYRTQQPQVYASHGPEIKQAVAELKSIYRRSVFPDMRVTPNTYPDWVGHDGCYRCHGKLVGSAGEATGKTIGASCLSCHYPAQVAPPAPAAAAVGATAPRATSRPALPAAVSHPIQGREQCSNCHAVDAPGVGSAGGLGVPPDHGGRGNDTCLGCHAVALPSAAQAAPPAPPGGAAAAPSAPTAVPAGPPPPGAAPAPATSSGPPTTPHPVQGREQCGSCHTPGGPDIGTSGGLGMPADHQGRPDTSCLSCHQPKG